MKRSLFVFGLLSLLCSAAWSEGGRFRVLALTQIPGQERLEFLSTEGVAELPVPVSNVSPYYAIPVSGILDCYRRVPAPEEERPPLLRIVFPDTNEDVIVLLTPPLSGASSYNYLILEDDERQFPAGSVMVYNLMKKPIIAKLGENQVRLEHGMRRVVPVVERGETSFEGGVMFAAEFDGFGRVFSASDWYLSGSMKIIAILFTDTNGNPKVRRVRLTSQLFSSL